jgi:uncharacterized protein (DUF2235 family)
MTRIVVLSDGTGNSSAKLFKTNVWRLYQALDLVQPPVGVVPQVASYHDGVGTSSFRPLAILGGIFGWGLKRNVLDHYQYLCRTYRPGDQIYAFGFSRGAFTIRVLVGLILSQGLLVQCSDLELAYASRDAYRAYRRRFNSTNTGYERLLRTVRDLVIGVYRRLLKQTAYQEMRRCRVSVAFVGVWETVAAYGTPLAELTRGIDDWVFPLSNPDTFLSPGVEVARHALALDDERDTFHPLLWDEVEERKSRAPRGRLRQVWFAGMHSDVGGGYPDDSLSYPPLHWMMAEALKAGLRFRPDAMEKVAFPKSASAPLHDSRRGLASYYRYQPRKISARVNPPDRTARIMQDPNPRAWPLLASVMVHESVIERIRSAQDRYAPIVLPQSYTVVQWDGAFARRPETFAEAAARASGQIQVWNDVWRRRVNYFASVAASLALALLPALEGSSLLEANIFVQLHRLAAPFTQLVSPLVRVPEPFLPAFAHIWLGSFANNPGVFSIMAIALVGLFLHGRVLRWRIHDRMYALWRPLHGQEVSLPKSGWSDEWIQALRACAFYQTVGQFAKWRAVPFVFGTLVFLALGVLAASPIKLGVYRSQIQTAEADGTICNPALDRLPRGAESASPSVFSSRPELDIRQLCLDTGINVTGDKTYRISLTVREPWSDGTIAATPEGFGPERMTWPFGYLAIPFRRSVSGNWLQTFAVIVPVTERSAYALVTPQPPFPLDVHPAGPDYVARFKAPGSGRVRLWVNQVVVPWQGLLSPWPSLRLTRTYYVKNRGTADIDIQEDK